MFSHQNADPISEIDDWMVVLEGDTVNNTVYGVILGEGDSGTLRPYTFYYARTQVTYKSGLPYVYTDNDDIILLFPTEGMSTDKG